MFIPFFDNVNTWEQNKKILFIEDLFWMNQEESVLKNIDYEILDVDYCELGITAEEILEFAVSLSETVGGILNDYHKVEFSSLYWKRVLLIWLGEFVSFVALRYARLCKMLEEFPNEKFCTNILNNSKWKFILLDPTDLIRCDLRYVFHIYSSLLQSEQFPICLNTLRDSDRYLISNNEVIDFSSGREISLKHNFLDKIFNNMKSPKKAMEKCYYRLKNWIWRNNNNVQIAIAWFGSKNFGDKIQAQTNGKVAWFGENVPVWVPRIRNIPMIDWTFRKYAQNQLLIKYGDLRGWRRAVAKMVFAELPCCYIENYTRCSTVYKHFFQQYPNLKVILSSPGALFVESQFALSEQREKNVKYSFMMHGACKPSVENVKRQGYMLADLFYGWGKWGEDVAPDRMDYHHAPAEKLYDLYNKENINSSVKHGILYVGDYFDQIYQELEQHTIGRLYTREKIFIGSLEEKQRRNLTIRNYPNKIGTVLDNLIKQDYPNIRISRGDEAINQQTFAEALCSARLVILDHIETPWLETLYIRAPFIVFCDDDFIEHYFDLSTEKKYVDMMREVGLIQNGPEVAAKYVNGIYSNVEEWWNEARRQEVVEILRERYTEPYVDVEKWWGTEIKNILKRIDCKEKF